MNVSKPDYSTPIAWTMGIAALDQEGSVNLNHNDSPLEVAIDACLSSYGYDVRPIEALMHSRSASPLSEQRPGAGPCTQDGGALVLVSNLAVPAGPLRVFALRRKRSRMVEQADIIARIAWESGISRLVAVSSAFLESGHGEPGSDKPPPETAEAEAVEAAAKTFSDMGGGR